MKQGGKKEEMQSQKNGEKPGKKTLPETVHPATIFVHPFISSDPIGPKEIVLGHQGSTLDLDWLPTPQLPAFLSVLLFPFCGFLSFGRPLLSVSSIPHFPGACVIYLLSSWHGTGNRRSPGKRERRFQADRAPPSLVQARFELLVPFLLSRLFCFIPLAVFLPNSRARCMTLSPFLFVGPCPESIPCPSIWTIALRQICSFFISSSLLSSSFRAYSYSSASSLPEETENVTNVSSRLLLLRPDGNLFPSFFKL